MTNTEASNLGTVILRDGFPLAHVADEYAAMAWLHKHQPQSVDYAVEYGGYLILNDTPGDKNAHNTVRGWIAYLSQPYRTTDAVLVGTIAQLCKLADDSDATGDYLIQNRVALPLIQAARILLNYTSSPLDLVNGQIDAALVALARRFGIAEEEL